MEGADEPAAAFLSCRMDSTQTSWCLGLGGQVNYFLCCAEEQIIAGPRYWVGKMFESGLVWVFLLFAASWLLPPYSLSVGAPCRTITGCYSKYLAVQAGEWNVMRTLQQVWGWVNSSSVGMRRLGFWCRSLPHLAFADNKNTRINIVDSVYYTWVDKAIICLSRL